MQGTQISIRPEYWLTYNKRVLYNEKDLKFKFQPPLILCQNNPHNLKYPFEGFMRFSMQQGDTGYHLTDR